MSPRKALLTLLLSWSLAHLTDSRLTKPASWLFAGITVLLGVLILLIRKNPRSEF